MPSVDVVLPSFPSAPRTIEWEAQNKVGIVTSEFGGEQQIQNWQNSWLEGSVSYPLVKELPARAWEAFLMGVQGTAKTFQLGDPLRSSPQNSSAAGGTVVGGGQTGYSLQTSSSLLVAGDHIQLGLRLYHVIGVSGGLLGIWPQLRESPADGTQVVIHNARGLFRLKVNNPKWSVRVDKLYSINFEIREALP